MTIQFPDMVAAIDGTPSQPDFLQQVQAAFVSRVREYLIALACQAQNFAPAQEALRIYNTLSDTGRARLLLSAELGETLAGVAEDGVPTEDPEPLGRRLLDLVSREEAIVALANGRVTSYLAGSRKDIVWSSLGDRFAHRVSGEWRLDSTVMIDDLVALDFESPLNLRMDVDSGTSSQRRLEMTEEQKTCVVEKICAALDILDSIEPVYGQLVRNFTRRIIIRKSCDTFEEGRIIGRTLASEHSTSQRGSIKFLNFHLPEKSIVAVAESLLHETIHVFLASYELITTDFTSRDKSVRPVSPWSGNLIPNSSFIHAVFVYHACHRLFAAGAMGKGQLTQEQRRDMRAKLPHFASGFLVSRPLSGFLVDRIPLQPEVMAAIDDLQLRNKAFYAAQQHEPQLMVA